MAFEFDRRAKILVGVVVLIAAGAGAWFFFLDDFLNAPPPKTVVKPTAKPAAAEAKGTGEAAKAVAEAPKSAAEAKPALVPAKAAAGPATAKPIPTDPDRLIAEVIETSGVKAEIQNFGSEVGIQASQAGTQKVSEEDARAISEIATRIFEPDKMTAEVAAALKAAFDRDRMTRFLEVLRQPMALKMDAMERRRASPEETTKLLEDIRKNPPPPARQKLVQALDEITHSTESGVQLATLTAREVVDAMFDELEKAGKKVPKQARQMAGTRIATAEPDLRAGFRALHYLTYRDATDEELGEYVKLLDTDTGRWGLQLLSGAEHAAIESRVRPFAREVAQVAVRRILAKKPGAQPLLAAEEGAKEKPAEKPAEKAASPAAPAPAAQLPAYQRPANIRELYTRYNDLITATVMGDRAAVKELLDDGKYADIRQKDGVTPLMVAAANGDAAIAEMLLAKGADPNLRAAGGTTALSLARERGKADMVRLLQSRGAKE